MKKYDLYCYLCERVVCHGDKPVKIICESCIDVLEKEHAERVKEKNELKERLDSFINKYGRDLWS